MEIWAKSEGIRLSKHIRDILEVFEKIKDKVNDELRLPIKIGIFYHDFGKVLPKFQIEFVGNKNYEPFDILHDFPHSLFSIFWIDIKKLKEELANEKLIEMIISAVAYHHWRENFENYITGKKELKKFCEFILEIKDILKNNLQNEINSISDCELKNYIETVNLNERLLKEVKDGVKLYNIAIPPYKFDYEPLRESITKSIEDTKKWILISGFLQRCDHFASWCEEENESFDKVEIECVDSKDVKKNIINEIKQKTGIDDEQRIWQFLKVKDYTNQDLILIAPTGYGKTEFAFLWSADKKFIYTLPLRSAVNQIYNRSLKIFGNDKVGLLHSDADVYLIEKWGDVGDNIKLYELSKNLSFPVIISTGDQFFPYALKPPGYEKIFSLFSYSNLVIDEIQAYDPKACAIIVKFIEWVKTMGGNFLLMTATMPEFVKKILNEKKIQYEEINLYKEESEKFENIIKHKIKIEFIENEKKIFEIPNEILNKAIEEAQNGRRVLFILNTVKQAQGVYEKIKQMIETNKSTDIEVFLLHSRFSLEDRKNKEIEIIDKKFKNPKTDNQEGGKILVATQVVEASLDIDADVLFTEICPLDALIQRMGRVLRRIGPNFEFLSNTGNKRSFKDRSGKTYEIDLSKPNVYILVFKNGLESGDGRVYQKELLKLSIAWLWKKSKKEINDIDIKENEKKEFFEREFKEIFGESSQKSSKEKKKGGDNEILKKIIKENDWVKNLIIQEFEISEYEKYKIVSLFYKSLPDEGSYLRKFYETLEVLSAGYMSEKKTEAERIFREIHDIQIIPEKKIINKKAEPINFLEEFVKAIEQFDYGKTFADFKKEILSKYIVTVPYFNINENNWVFYKVQEIFSNDKNNKNKLVKLKRWLSGIYISKKHYYDVEKGIINKDEFDDSNII